MTTAPLAIDKVLLDPRLLGAALAPVETWSTWLTVLKAAFALPLTDAEREVFKVIAGDRGLPKQRVRELWVLRGPEVGQEPHGCCACPATSALFVKHKLAVGERGLVLVLGSDAGAEPASCSSTCSGSCARRTCCAARSRRTTRSEIRLKNGIVIAVHPNSFR